MHMIEHFQYSEKRCACFAYMPVFLMIRSLLVSFIYGCLITCYKRSATAEFRAKTIPRAHKHTRTHTNTHTHKDTNQTNERKHIRSRALINSSSLGNHANSAESLEIPRKP